MLILRNADNIKNTSIANTKLIWIETPTNPLMNITDIAAVSALPKKKYFIGC